MDARTDVPPLGIYKPSGQATQQHLPKARLLSDRLKIVGTNLGRIQAPQKYLGAGPLLPPAGAPTLLEQKLISRRCYDMRSIRYCETGKAYTHNEKENKLLPCRGSPSRYFDFCPHHTMLLTLPTCTNISKSQRKQANHHERFETDAPIQVCCQLPQHQGSNGICVY